MCRADEIKILSNNGDVAFFNPKDRLENTTVLQLKGFAVEKFPRSASNVGDVRLIHGNKPLDVDSAPVTNYGIKARSVVQMVRKVHGG